MLAIVRAPHSLDVHNTSTRAACDINLSLYETESARDEDARLVFDLAAAARISEGGHTYAFPLRSNALF